MSKIKTLFRSEAGKLVAKTTAGAIGICTMGYVITGFVAPFSRILSLVLMFGSGYLLSRQIDKMRNRAEDRAGKPRKAFKMHTNIVWAIVIAGAIAVPQPNFYAHKNKPGQPKTPTPSARTTAPAIR